MQSTTLILPPSDDRERDEITEATLLSPTLHKTGLAAELQENVAKVQEKLEEEDIEKMVEGEEDEESYAIEFADSMFNDDDDSSTMIELESHKENLKVDDDDEVNDKKKQDEKKDDDVKKTDDATEEKENDDHTDHTLVGTHAIWVNLTALTLAFPGIEAHEPSSIVDKPTTCLIYLNIKDEKRVMYLIEIVKFYDATLERVSNEVKLRIF
nr:hypothetical protein [Tanacetum cinerariifolium]